MFFAKRIKEDLIEKIIELLAPFHLDEADFKGRVVNVDDKTVDELCWFLRFWHNGRYVPGRIPRGFTHVCLREEEAHSLIHKAFSVAYGELAYNSAKNELVHVLRFRKLISNPGSYKEVIERIERQSSHLLPDSNSFRSAIALARGKKHSVAPSKTQVNRAEIFLREMWVGAKEVQKSFLLRFSLRRLIAV